MERREGRRGGRAEIGREGGGIRRGESKEGGGWGGGRSWAHTEEGHSTMRKLTKARRLLMTEAGHLLKWDIH